MAAKAKPKKGPGRGGARPGSGRPREPRDHGVKWVKVREFARLGADRELIVAAMGLDAALLCKPEVLQQLQAEVARGAALHQLDLLRDVKRIREGGPGKVNAVLASLKQKLQWNKPDAKGGEQARPDVGTAVAEVLRMLGRFRAPG